MEKMMSKVKISKSRWGFLLIGVFSILAAGTQGCSWDGAAQNYLGPECEGWAFVSTNDEDKCKEAGASYKADGQYTTCEGLFSSLNKAFNEKDIIRLDRCKASEYCDNGSCSNSGLSYCANLEFGFNGNEPIAANSNGYQYCMPGFHCNDTSDKCLQTAGQGETACTPETASDVCGQGAECINGACKCGSYNCGDPKNTCCPELGCFDLNENRNNCGTCGQACPTGQICTMGKCDASCLSGQVLCGEGDNISCIIPGTDAKFCGAKGNCSGTDPDADDYAGENCTESGKECKDGVCVLPQCQGTQVLCGNQCRDAMTDNDYCGATGTNKECTDIGTKCEEGQVCVSGKCVENSCSNGETLCDVAGVNTCININADNAEHCGKCNNRCEDNPVANATPKAESCSKGLCRYQCNDGFVNCGSGDTAATINCIDPEINSLYCGAKGTCSGKDAASENYAGISCTSSQVCVSGSCEQNTCKTNETLCDVNGNKECILLKSDNEAQCGTCNYSCSAHPIQNATSNTCNAGKCEYTCNSGYINCGDGNLSSNINCIDPLTNSHYCGAKGTCSEDAGNNFKGKTCDPDTEVCVNGSCEKNSCTGNTPNLCVVNEKNTCVNIKANDQNHCGACNYSCEAHSITNAKSETCNAGNCIYQCDSGFENCGTNTTAATISCVDLTSDKNNCGTCKNVCGTGEVCVNSKCEKNSCSGNTPNLCVVNNKNSCVNIKANDKNHCGACNYSCEAHTITNAKSDSCSSGNCIYSCNSGFDNCGTGNTAATISCVDLTSDKNNCGACKNACGAGEVCVNSKCEKNSCSGDNPNLCVVNEKNTCVNIKASDAKHCGACNYACEEHSITNAKSNTCSSGNCVYKCDSGYDNCGTGQTAATISCVDLTSDKNNCGACKNACGSGEVCVNSKCVKNSCSGSETLCVVNNNNTCIDIKASDTKHCGACNYSCEAHAITNAKSNSCQEGNCIYSCNSGFDNCGTGTTAATISCVDLTSDKNNCGACKNVCGAGEVCVNSKCEKNSCSGDNPNLCVVDGKNACVNIKSNNASHCGACNYSCEAHTITNAKSTSCSDGNCIYSCNDGFENCGAGDTANSINCIDLTSDKNHCGDCSKSCGSGEVCVNSKCVKNSCSGDNPNLCVVSGNNTCVNINSNDAQHCGACNYACASHSIPNAASNTCSSGSCQYSCNEGYINCGTGKTAATISCINPMSDNYHCGADGACSSDNPNDENYKGKACAANETCVNGTCVKNSCSGDLPNLCVVGGINMCKKINGTDNEHCGACNYKCSEHAITNASSNSCLNGSCQYTCSMVNDIQYINCGTGNTANTISCINPRSDNYHCGAKGTCSSDSAQDENYKGATCAANETCVNGACVKNSCSNGQTLCVVGEKNECKFLSLDDAEHCGACNYKCSDHAITNATSNSCANGNCQYTCASGFVNCGEGKTSNTINCIDPKTNKYFCGAKLNGTCSSDDANNDNYKGKKCGDKEVCVNGECVTNSCSAGETLCDVNGSKLCKNLSSSLADHCGACNYKCEDHPITNATSTTCATGSCQYQCNTDYINCGSGNSASTINCIDPKTNRYFCGAKGTCDADSGDNYHGSICADNEVCVNGACVPNSCSAGQTLCVVDNENECKVITTTDADHCGACNYKCESHPITNATSNSCVSGSCQYSCSKVNNVQYINCGTGKTAGTISCINPNTNALHCGAKGTCSDDSSSSANYKGDICDSNEVCVNGECVPNSCNSGQTLCDVGGNNQCINVQSNVAAHCGACNYACSDHAVLNATSNTCNSGSCKYTCSTIDNVQYINCGSGDSANTISCINPNTSNSHCGAKGTCTDDSPNSNNYKGASCDTGYTCSGGVCVVACPASQIACYGQCYIKSTLSSMFHMDNSCNCLTNYSNENNNWDDGCEKLTGCTNDNDCNGTKVCCSGECVTIDSNSSCGTCADHDACDSGYTCCETGNKSYTCKNLSNDTSNCGTCGSPCSKNANTCVDGVCKCGETAACSGTSDTCTAGVCKCGSGAACTIPTPYGQTAACSNSNCVVTCQAGYVGNTCSECDSNYCQTDSNTCVSVGEDCGNSTTCCSNGNTYTCRVVDDSQEWTCN